MKKILLIICLLIIGGIGGYWLNKTSNRNPCEEAVLGKPLPNDLTERLKDNSIGNTSKFKLISDDTQIDAKSFSINMYDWILFINQFNVNTDSIQFYPAVKTGTDMCYLMTVINNSDFTILERYYYVLSKDVAVGEFKNIEKVQFDVANSYFKHYRDTFVSLEYDKSNKYRPVRTYSIKEIKSFMRLNGVKSNQADLSEYKNWKLTIFGSMIDDYIAGEIETYWPDELAEISKFDQIGFTVVLNVEDKYGREGTAFEIGKPCPPRCGELRVD